MNYVQSDIIINEVKNDLTKYFEASAIDESILYRAIRTCISQMGYMAHPLKSDVVTIVSNQGKLPSDFKSLCLALGCWDTTIITPPAYPVLNMVEKNVNCEEICFKECNVCKDSCGNYFKVIQRNPSYEISYNTVNYLSITKASRPICSTECFNFNVKSNYEIDIRNGFIHTNFEEGAIYIEYVGQLEDKDGYLIPDNETIIDWIIEEMKVKCFEVMFDNGENVASQLKYHTELLVRKKENARTLYKRKEVYEFYDLRNFLINRYKQFTHNA